MMMKATARKALYFLLLLSICCAGIAGYSILRQNINITHGQAALKNKSDVLRFLEVEGEEHQISVFSVIDAPLRQIAVADEGWVFVGSRADKVYAVRDEDGDGVAERIVVVAESLDSPHGVAYHRGDLYIGAISTIYRVTDIMAWLQRPAAAPLPLQPFIEGLPTSSHHGMRHIKVAPDGKLYVALGVPCNICIPPSETFTGVIRRYALTGGDAGEVYARGIRNAVGFDFHPPSGDLWFTDNGRDWLGDDAPHDELNRVSVAGEHFGYPYCHQGDLPDPEYGEEESCTGYTPPLLLTGAHVANLGMVFNEEGSRAYIALHGSWNSSVKVGYALYQATIAQGKVVEYAPFVTGWLRPDETVYGRPVDIARAVDGALLVTDDYAGIIYRISKIR